MNRIFNTTNSSPFTDLGILLIRLTAGGFMLSHGIPKFTRMMGGDWSFADPIGLGEPVSLILTIIAEALCPLLLIVGLGTRVAALFPAVVMAVAGFIVHSDDPVGKRELVFIYLAVFIALSLLGSGKYSIDHRIATKGFEKAGAA